MTCPACTVHGHAPLLLLFFFSLFFCFFLCFDPIRLMVCKCPLKVVGPFRILKMGPIPWVNSQFFGEKKNCALCRGWPDSVHKDTKSVYLFFLSLKLCVGSFSSLFSSVGLKPIFIHPCSSQMLKNGQAQGLYTLFLTWNWVQANLKLSRRPKWFVGPRYPILLIPANMSQIV